MEKSWQEMRLEYDRGAEEYFEKQLENATKTGSTADREFFSAAREARRSVKSNGLWPRRTEDGELRYTVQQGLTAACHTREDVVGIAILQRAILRRLDRNRNLMWIAIALLVVIAVRLA
jgi:hypothetical protein